MKYRLCKLKFLNVKKIISLSVAFAITLGLAGPQVFAENDLGDPHAKNDIVLENNEFNVNSVTSVTYGEIQYIPDKYFPKKQKPGEIQPMFIPAAAGIYFIPGVGEVALVATGTVVVGGAAYYAGSAVYEKVRVYFAEKEAAQEKSYQDAKQRGVPAGTHSEKHPPFNKLGINGKSRSSEDLYDSKGLKQRRYYDKNGNADEDIDYDHSNADGSHTFPHRHKWVNGRRSR
ncbi:hypothetical protein IAQ67_06060 [Paenibacillus peoriae]|uniref:Uncharacterized protein n=1 Tax=Paenibacillus peoriae TaxID=59893 RepID=A0A7H0YGY8_9BACL|nr:hypothetical protein [Paenibacillus peoriae]QNR70346.1 hypothetical protein IAQ67_06060 [Paenibacillus peoriae]